MKEYQFKLPGNWFVLKLKCSVEKAFTLWIQLAISCETETYFILCYICLKLHRTLLQNKDKLKQNLDHARLIVVHVHSFVDTKVWKQSLYIWSTVIANKDSAVQNICF